MTHYCARHEHGSLEYGWFAASTTHNAVLRSMENTAQIFLIADNNTCAVRSTKWRLERLLGNNINVVTGHNEIVRNGNHSRLRVVLVGCRMPKCSGLQAAAEIRNIERSNNISRPVAIIGTTTDLNHVIHVHAGFIKAGANVVLEKLVREGELELLITAILEDGNI